MHNADTIMVQTRHGPFWVFRTDQYVARALQIYGEYAQDEVDLFAQIVRPGTTVVEAGGNIGALTVPLARLCAPGPIHVFEPQQRAKQILCANLTINGIRNALVYGDGLGSSPSIAALESPDYSAPGNFGSISLESSAGKGAKIRISRLDDWPLPSCDFIKIDVEGWEAEVLRGARETIARFKPVIYVENDRAAHQAEIIDYLDKAGYRMYWHVAPLYHAKNFNGVVENVFGHTVALNMIALPADDRRAMTGFDQIDPQSWSSPVPPIGDR